LPLGAHLTESAVRGDPEDLDRGWCQLPVGTAIGPSSCTGFVWAPEVRSLRFIRAQQIADAVLHVTWWEVRMP
jgi:hypothetical protein